MSENIFIGPSIDRSYWVAENVALELVFYQFFEHQSGDSGFQGSDDEIFINGTSFDTAEIHGNNEQPTHGINLPTGDVSDPLVNSAWISDTAPYVVYRFNLENINTYPRTCVVQLQVVEEDNEDLNDTFKKIDEKYRTKLSDAITKAGSEAIGIGFDALIPGSKEVAREVSKLILDQLVPLGIETLLDPIFSGLGNEVFMPAPFVMFLPDQYYDFHDGPQLFPTNGKYHEKPQEWIWTPLVSNHINTGNEHYEFVYYWKIQRKVYKYTPPWPNFGSTRPLRRIP